MIEKIKEEAKKFHDSKTGHEWDHVERVHKLALHIGRVENADLEILELAVFLHDIGRKLQDESNGQVCHAEKGAELAKDILKKYNYPEEKINKIIHCIETHRFLNNKIPQTKEAMILFDADHLDGIGAVGIGRAFYFAGNIGSKLHNSDVNIKETKPYTEDDTAFREFALKLKTVKDKMFTNEGKKLAQQRHDFMIDFFNRLDSEYLGEL